jgi:surface antigen
MKKIALITAAALALSSCQTTDGGRSAAIMGGAALGGLLGNQFGSGSGRLLATAVGALAGGFLADKVFQSLTEVDKAELSKRTTQVAESSKPNEVITWKAPESGETIRVTAGEIRSVDQTVKLKRISQVEPIPTGAKLQTRVYLAKESIRLRSTPAIEPSNVIGGFKQGDLIQVIAQLPEAKWSAVGQNGTLVGYVASEYLDPNLVKPASKTAKPSLQNGVDLDQVAATESSVSLKTECRTMTYDLDKGSKQANACKQPDGSWSLS